MTSDFMSLRLVRPRVPSLRDRPVRKVPVGHRSSLHDERVSEQWRRRSTLDTRALPAETAAVQAHWYVYVLVSTRGERTYVGITCDVDRRLAQHNGEQPGGAKSTRAGRPWRIGTTFGPYETRAEAQRIEYQVKRRSGSARLEPL